MTDNANAISGQIVDAAMKVHSVLGPGLLERAYASCLAFELRRRGLDVKEEVPLPVIYEWYRIDLAYRIDLLVEDAVIVETKAVAQFHPIHSAQLLSRLRLSGRRVGLLLNFNVPRMREGKKRMVNG